MPRKIVERDLPDAAASQPLEADRTDESFTPKTRLIAALVNEAARARIRHRTLMEILLESGQIDISRYLERYSEIEERDFVPFVELLILSVSEFNDRHAEWLAENLERFGYDGG